MHKEGAQTTAVNANNKQNNKLKMQIEGNIINVIKTP
jgi:hypothetical protein